MYIYVSCLKKKGLCATKVSCYLQSSGKYKKYMPKTIHQQIHQVMKSKT